MDGKKPLFSADAAEEYFSTLLTYYRNTANDIFKRDNEGRHVSDQIYSAEYQKYLGMQIAMREVLEYFAKFELEDTALRQQEHFREDTKKVESICGWTDLPCCHCNPGACSNRRYDHA